jgi:hypothetical protein
MVKVRALRKCFIDNVLRSEGEVFEYGGPKASCLRALNEEKPTDRPRKAAKKKDDEE